MLIFADAWLGWVLGPVVAVWAVVWLLLPRWRRRRDREPVIGFPETRRFGRLGRSLAQRARPWVVALRLVTVVLLALALARPQTGRTLTEVQTEGVDILLVLDTSGSMRALDLDADRPMKQRRNRLEVAKDVVAEFVEKRPSDRIGLVVFGDEAYTQCPLTLDQGVLLQLVDRVDIGLAGGERTAMGDALGIAVKRLRESEAESKVAILLTDGLSNAGVLSPRKAAEAAAAFDVRVYTVAAGSRGRAPFLTDTLFGERVVYQDVEIDEETLREVSRLTGGRSFRAEDHVALAEIYDEIDRLEKTEITTASYLEYDERFAAFVGPALLALLLEVVLLRTRLRRLP